MKHTFKRHDGSSIVVEPSQKNDGCYVTSMTSRGYAANVVFVPAALAGVVAQAIELSAPAERPLINAQAIEAAKSFGEGLTL